MIDSTLDNIQLKSDQLDDMVMYQAELLLAASRTFKLTGEDYSSSTLNVPFVVVGEDATKGDVTTVLLQNSDGSHGWAYSDEAFYVVLKVVDKGYIIPVSRLRGLMKKRVRKTGTGRLYTLRKERDGSFVADVKLEDLKGIAINR